MTAARAMVTGLGMTTPVGRDVRSTWEAFLQGRSGVQPLAGPAYAGLPVRIAAPAAHEPDQATDRIERRRWDRGQQLAVVAARQAWADAGFSLDVGARGGSHAPASACATGAEAIGQAVRMIRSGETDIVVAGGTEAAIHPFTVAGFAAMRALSRRNEEPAKASRPFDAARDGFVLGEGAAILVLESAAHARARGVTPYAEAVGVGYSSDTYHVARADPAARAAQLAMRRAMTEVSAALGQVGDAALGQVVHVNAHAIATPAGDAAEARAIRAVLGEAPVVTSTKSMTGHLLGAAGAVEAIAAILALREGVIPPTINLDEQDPEIELDIVADKPRPLPALSGGRPPLVLSNSFGFGGHNVTLAFPRSLREPDTSAGQVLRNRMNQQV